MPSKLTLVKEVFKAGLSSKYPSVRDYEGQHTKRFLKTVKPGHVVADVGACYGYYTALALQAGAGTVFTFEPNHEHVAALRSVLAAHTDRVTLIQKAASNVTGTVDLFYLPKSGGRGVSATREMAELDRPANVKAKKQKYESIKLDDVLMDGVDVIKIDTEGHELEVLEGALATLHKFHPILFLSIHKVGVAEAAKLRTLLRDLEYVFVDDNGDEFESPSPFLGAHVFRWSPS